MILCHTLSHNTRAWLQKYIVSEVSSRRSARAQAAAGAQLVHRQQQALSSCTGSSRRSARAQAAAGLQQFQQNANHCWLTAAAVVRVWQAKPNEYSWSRMFDLEKNYQHVSIRIVQPEEQKRVSLYLNKCQIIFFCRDGQSIWVTLLCIQRNDAVLRYHARHDNVI